ncbi:T9SS type A sorting domain-containing protein [Bernardetia sp. OM2101]|uniref:T9SS type A sorting domain-containing protein n=1 Tax=Bernardetia sp. OM2101 TaxID=3344876 RepID=UPI0035D049CC
MNFSPVAQITQGSSINLCADATLSAANVVEGAEYRWIEAENIIAMGTSTSTRGSGTYILEVTQNGCISRDEIEVTVTNLPEGVTVSASQATFCPNDQVTLSVDNPDTNLTYTWVRNGRVLRNQEGDTFTTTIAGTYQVQISQNGCTTFSETVDIERISVADAFLRTTESTLFVESSETISNVEWLKNGESAPSFEGQVTITPNESDNYSAIITYNSGCQKATRTVYFRLKEDVVLGEDKNTPFFFNVFPNPSINGQFTIQFEQTLTSQTTLEVSDVIGRKIQKIKLQKGISDYRLDLKSLAKGSYIIKVVTQNQKYKIVKVVIE